MLQYICDWCRRTKQPADAWLLGFAAENIGVVSARREITVSSAWNDAQARHPLAVHFCSDDHKDRYMAALFGTEPAAAEAVETTLEAGRPQRTTRKVVRMVAPVKTTRRTVVKRKRKRA